MLALYDKTCRECSQHITKKYSTSFSLGITVFHKKYRAPIYSIYGFVRFADEIVDTFHGFDKAKLLKEFREDTYKAIHNKISLNPVLHAFQEVVNTYHIDHEFIDAFLDSMEMDLFNSVYNQESLDKYIYGSAEVVGLMCLRVFCPDPNEFDRLKPTAKALGSAFQKINFLRDMKSDYEERGRVYFPDIDFAHFTNKEKQIIEDDILKDFDYAYKGIVELPKGVRLGVYLAYVYYKTLFQKIKNTTAKHIAQERIRVRNRKKILLLGTSALRNSFNML